MSLYVSWSVLIENRKIKPWILLSYDTHILDLLYEIIIPEVLNFTNNCKELS